MSMKGNKKLIIINILIITTCLIIALSTAVNALSDVSSEYMTGKTDTQIGSNITNIGNMFIGVIQVVGGAVAIIMLVMVGIKYISASPNERADMKKGLTAYVVGAVILFSAVGILTILKDTIEGL